MTARRTRLIARVAIERDGLLLCARHRRDGGFWCLPGGKVEEGERATQAAVRELSEEAGVDVALGGIVYVQDAADGYLELVFRGDISRGEPHLPVGAEAGLAAIAWQPARDLPADFLPGAFARLVAAAGGVAGLPSVPALDTAAATGRDGSRNVAP